MENFNKPIESTPDNVISMIIAIIYLHNLTKNADDEQITYDDELTNLQVKCNKLNKSTAYSVTISESFCKYFNNEGAVPWLYNM